MAVVAVGEVGYEAAAYVVAGVGYAPYNLACACVAKFGVVFFLRLLMHHEHLQTGARWVEVAQMERVAVAGACAVEQRSVVVYAGRAVYNLVAAVAVDITHR